MFTLYLNPLNAVKTTLHSCMVNVYNVFVELNCSNQEGKLWVTLVDMRERNQQNDTI